MPNTLGLYDPLFYAQEALIVLYKKLGLAGRVFRGYDAEPQQKGSTIQIRRPGTFAAQNAPSSAQFLAPESVSITLDQWREVKFGLTDKELSHTKEDIIREHISPAAYALADDLDQKLAALIKRVPWRVNQAGASVTLADIAAVRKQLFDNKVPMDEGSLFMMVDGQREADILTLLAPWNTAGDQSAAARQSGSIRRLFGLDIFANQNSISVTSNNIADDVGAINNAAGYAKGATTIAFDGVSAAATFLAGEIFTIAGHTQQYVLTANATSDGTGAVASASIFPALAQSAADNDVLTFVRNNNSTRVWNVGFHRNAFALATAPLSEMGNELGARIATVADPVTGVSLRSRLYYEGANSTVFVALDILYGYTVLDPNLATRFHS